MEFAFNADDPGDYERMKRRREIAEAMLSGGRRAPKNVAEGIYSAMSDIGAGLGARSARKGMDGLRDSAGDFASGTFGRLGGGGDFPPAPDMPGSTGGVSPGGSAGADPDLVAYIRESATQRGVDPDIALKVARSEGLAPGVWQSNVRNASGLREPSYGPFQLLVGGKGTGFPAGMGNDFMSQTGLDPRDPKTVRQQIDFALDQAKQGGWSPWYGAAKVGVGKWDGLRAPSDQGASLERDIPGNMVAGLGDAGVADALKAADAMGGVQVADASGFGSMSMEQLKALDLNSMSQEDLLSVKRRFNELKNPPQIQSMSVDQLKALDLNSLSPEELQSVKSRFQELRPAAPQGEVTRGGELPPTISPDIDSRMNGAPQLPAPTNVETRSVAGVESTGNPKMDRFNEFARRSGSKQLINADPTKGLLGVLTGMAKPSNRAGFPARPGAGQLTAENAAQSSRQRVADAMVARQPQGGSLPIADNPFLSEPVKRVAGAMLGQDQPQAAPMEFASLSPANDFRMALAQPQGDPQSAQAMQGIPTPPAPANDAQPVQTAQAQQLTQQDIRDLIQIAQNPASSPADRATAQYYLQQHQARQMTPLQQLQLEKARKELNTPAKREMFKDANGRQRFVDTGELAVPDLEVNPEFRMLTADEVKTMGLPEGAYQVGGDGRVYPIRSQSNGISFTTADGTEIQIGGSASGLKQEGKNDANLLKEAQTAAKSSSDLKQTTSMLRKANKTSGYKGPGAGLIGAADDVFESLGGNLPGTDRNQSGPRALMKSGGLTVALENVSKTKGAISNAEMGLFMAASPGMQTTTAGNAALLDMIDQIADRTVMRATAMEKWLGENQTLRGFTEAWETWLRANPLIVETTDGGVKLSDGEGNTGETSSGVKWSVE